ncbi:MAG: glycosyltransferase [Terracidiphilus sp.]
MKIAFMPACGPGHLNPMTTLARAMKSRGHEAVVISTLDAEPFVHAAGLPFLPCCERESPRGSITTAFQHLGTLQGDQAMAFTFWLIANSVQSTFRDLPRILRTQAIDAVVIDEVQSELGLVPQHLGLPYVNASCALHFDMSGNTPLCVYDWPHANTPEALARNRQGVQRFRQTVRFGNAAGKAYAEQVSLDIDWSDPLATISKLAWVTQVPREFDFDGAVWPSQFHHTGPFHDDAGRIPSEFPWDRLTGEPLVYASMGTLQNGIEDVFTAIAEAVNRKPDLQLVMSIGPNVDATKIAGLRNNTILATLSPQIEILKRAALCITHAGLNTVLETLANGVPIVAIPVTNDQPGVAARVAHSTTGTFVPLQQMTIEKLSALVDEVLENPVYRQNARRLRKAIAGRNGLELAVDLFEQAFGIATEVTSATGRAGRENA